MPPPALPGFSVRHSDVPALTKLSANRDTSVGKTYIRFRLQTLAKALEFKEFQIWQLPCWLNRVRLQNEARSACTGSLQPALVVSATILRHEVPFA
jgi:hypothetical protein